MAVDDMKLALLESLDELSSSRSSLAQRCRALTIVDHTLAICAAQLSTEKMDTFLLLQNGFECNVASRLIFAMSSWLPDLQSAISATPTEDPESEMVIAALVYPIIQALSILQGVTMLHPSSKYFLGRKWPMQVLIDILVLSRYVPPNSSLGLPDYSSTPSSKAPPNAPALAAAVLDTILCILVDAPTAIRSFEEVSGVEIVVKTLKRAGIEKDVRMKCLEFLYFYLLPEDETLLNGSFTHSRQSSPHFAYQPPPMQHSVIPPVKDSPAFPLSHDHPFYPNPIDSPKVAKPLAMLRKDLEFMPTTPRKKAQVAKVGVGTPKAVLRMPSRPSFKSWSPPKKIGLRQSLSADTTFVDIPHTPTKPRPLAAASSMPTILAASPRRGKDLTIDCRSPPTTPIKRKPTDKSIRHIRRKSSFEGNATLVSSSPAEVQVKRMVKDSQSQPRDVSWADNTTLGGSPSPTKRALPFSGTWDDLSLIDMKGSISTKVKTTAEKKELLGTWLGNVDVLVEGVQRAGIWGLA